MGDQWVRDCSSVGSVRFSGTKENSPSNPFYIMEHAGFKEICRENILTQVLNHINKRVRIFRI